MGAAMQQVGLTTQPGNPIVTTRLSGKFAFVELRSIEETNNALNVCDHQITPDPSQSKLHLPTRSWSHTAHDVRAQTFTTTHACMHAYHSLIFRHPPTHLPHTRDPLLRMCTTTPAERDSVHGNVAPCRSAVEVQRPSCRGRRRCPRRGPGATPEGYTPCTPHNERRVGGEPTFGENPCMP